MTSLRSTQIVHSGVSLSTVLGQKISVKLTYTTGVDPAAIAAGATLEITFPVSGAAVGDICLMSMTALLGKVIASCQVVGTNSLRLRLYNAGSTTADISSGTLRVILI